MPLAFRKRLSREKIGVIVRGDRTINELKPRGQLVLIEPDISVRDALTLLLEAEGWEVHIAENCEALLAEFRSGGLTAVISESSMADCTPQEILEQSARHGVPVIFTGHDLPLQGAVDLIRQGAVDFLDKPFPQTRLLELLNRLHDEGKGHGQQQTVR